MNESISAVGMYERHLLRKEGNPLFAVPPVEYPAEALLAARQRDLEELQRFNADMRTIIQEAIDLEPSVESEVLLTMRGRLDQLYTRCSGFGGSCGEHKQSIRKLIELVMRAVWQAAAEDPLARSELEHEEMARLQHFRLLEYPLIADLVRPDTPIAQDELIPTLLQASEEELEAVLWLFEPEQLVDISVQAEALLEGLRAQGYELGAARQNLQLIIEHLESEC